MKTLQISLGGLLLSIFGIYILASMSEHDINAIGMYFVVFLFPTILVVVINAIYLLILDILPNKTVRILLGLLPIGILVILTLQKELKIKGIEGNLVFVTLITSITLGLTNLIWIIKQLKMKSI